MNIYMHKHVDSANNYVIKIFHMLTSFFISLIC